MSSSTDDRIVVGRIGRPHGLDGEATILPQSDDPGRFAPGARFITDSGRELVVASVTPYREHGLRVRFEGVDSREAIEALRGSALTIDPSQRRALDRDEYWEDDLVGLAAVTPSGTALGTVARVDRGPGQDRLVVETSDGSEVLVPFVAEFVGDPEGGRIVIDAPEGLFP